MIENALNGLREAPVSNYYGGPYVFIADGGECKMGVENCMADDVIDISREFYDAFIKEFGDQEADS